MRRLLILLFATAALGRLACGQQHAHELTEEEIGSVHFLTTCSKTTEASFSRAVALLHSFQYELARSVFTDISSLDQNCAMAYWGIGMDYRLEPLSVREFSENVVITRIAQLFTVEIAQARMRAPTPLVSLIHG